MSRNFQRVHFQTEKFSLSRLFNEKIRFNRLDFQLKSKTAKEFAIGNHRRSEPVATDWTIKLSLDPGDILDVIDVSVGQQEKFKIYHV